MLRSGAPFHERRSATMKLPTLSGLPLVLRGLVLKSVAKSNGLSHHCYRRPSPFVLQWTRLSQRGPNEDPPHHTPPGEGRTRRAHTRERGKERKGRAAERRRQGKKSKNPMGCGGQLASPLGHCIHMHWTISRPCKGVSKTEKQTIYRQCPKPLT